jgi:phospholipid transport system substrate-binding protein
MNPSGARAAPGATAPDALVKQISAEVIAVLKQDQAAGRPTDVAQLVEQKILPLFDFERMTRMALARNWRGATPAQQSALVDYEMAERPAGWKVYDVKVAGVSLVITYRESFASVVRDAGIDGLIKTLSEKNRPYAAPSSAAGK